ncbi:hypothetical protein PMG11_08424 [Penicillium brasilianum]|uniref:histidine kinase n=1 Tax=Penicillium brasilianum TaxID=104259 RepID=A0A0F7TWP7_PENBI|nr:hypothetical protein PMG11_08424 [Penicillium brasilianum]
MEASVREQRDGDRRARELYHYFQPDNPALLSPGDAHAIPSASTVKSSPNLVLTALTQLAAVKLGVQRAIISLIDRETLYVVAEASRSLHLGKFDVFDDDGDGLWMGCARGPVAGTLCEKTITLLPTPERKYPFFVVDDLRLHPAYCNIPCVARDPFFRFYAGTPLTTSNGINIGSLYVIDPRPNLPLTEAHRETLGSIADAVMDYMETSRQSLEAERLTKLLSGLSTFVQGEDNADPLNKSMPHSAASSDQDRSRTPSPHHGEKHIATSPSPRETNRSPPSPAVSQLKGVANPANHAIPLLPPATHIASSPHVPASSSVSSGSRVNQTFQRAASLMRQSLGLESHGGVLIVNTNVPAETNAVHGVGQHRHKGKMVRVCALVDAEVPSIESGSGCSSLPATQMDLSFARRVLRRYRRGGLWYFHQDGTAFSSDDEEISCKGQRNESFSPSTMHPQSFGTMPAKDAKALKKYFPSATKIIFVPLWDSFSSRWFGGCFIWSSLETRVFSAHVDLGGLFGFGSSLMVEYSRILSQDSDKKKADFISTISHELRSPLHGILAANELLAEYVVSESASRLLDTIRACGQTLLDTFEQILDYTKINSFASKRQHSRNDKLTSQPLHIAKSVNVVELVEEVVESVFAGQILSGVMTPFGSSPANWSLDVNGVQNTALELGDCDHVDLILDAAHKDWEFVLEPGALRRIVMNVLGNALKYTQRGAVTIRLEIQENHDGDTSQALSVHADSQVLLITVSDTGKGISAEYLQSHIFTPFSQEDGLSPGTGLGLSLVHSILRSVDGKIAIESQVGVGTTVKMAFPISQPRHRKPSDTQTPRYSSLLQSSSPIAAVRSSLEGKILRVITPQDPASVPSPPNNMIKYYLTEWFGMISQTNDSTLPADLSIVDEHDLHLLVSPPQTLLLVLCHRGPKSWSRTVGPNKILPNSFRVTLPCGPHQLARTLLNCFQGTRLKKSPSIDKRSSLELSSHSFKCDQVLKTEISCNPAAADPPSPQKTSYLNQTIGLKPHITEYGGDKPKISAIPSPPVEENSPNIVANNLQSMQVSPNGSKPRPRILLVEDNAINLALLEKIVARTKPEILDTATNGQEAVNSVRAMSGGYQYIFMDISMPIMDGFEATRIIRSIERARQAQIPAKIIALTGLGSDEHIARAYEAGVNLFLTKPISFKEILRLLNEDEHRRVAVPGVQSP